MLASVSLHFYSPLCFAAVDDLRGEQAQNDAAADQDVTVLLGTLFDVVQGRLDVLLLACWS